MSTYRTSMMLYSSVFALSLVAAPDVFCSEQGIKKPDSTSVVKEKTSERETAKSADVKVSVDSKKSGDTGSKPKNDIIAPLTEAEEADEENKTRKEIARAQKKANFAKNVALIFAKYSALLSSISGENREVIAQKLRAHNEKVRAALLDALVVAEAKSEDTIFSKLRTKLNQREIFISSKEQSIGKDDKEFFKEVHTSLIKGIKGIENLHAEYIKRKGNADKQKETEVIYADKLNNFLASYGMFTACTHYLASAKTYCNDSAISFNNMKVQFPEFSAKAFKEAAVPADILSGKRDPFASIKGYRFYAIGKDEYQNGKFLSQIPAESEDGKFIMTAKGAKSSQLLLSPENGGLILSSQMIQKEGMDRPICVFSSYAADGGKETVYRFSLVHESEEAAGKQLTAQLIQAEAQPERSKLVEAVAELRAALTKEPKGSSKPTQKSTDKDDKAKDKTVKDADKTETKVAKAHDKPKDTEAKSKAGDATDSKAKKKADTTEESSEGKAKKKADTTEESSEGKAKKKAGTTEESSEGKTKKKVDTTEGSSDSKAKKKADTTEGSSDSKAKKKADTTEESSEGKAKKKADTTEESSEGKAKKKADTTEESSEGKDKKKKDEAVAEKKVDAPKEESGFFGKLFGGSKSN